MNERLLIVADLEHFRAFRISDRDSGMRISEQNMDSKITLEPLNGFENITPHKKIRERVSDKTGRFGLRSNTGMLNFHSGEEHNFKAEERRRVIQEIADNISRILSGNKVESWYFAAPAKINNEIVEKIDQKNRNKLKKNILHDLTNAPKKKLIYSLQA